MHIGNARKLQVQFFVNKNLKKSSRNSFVKKYRDKMIAADASSQAGKKSEEDKLEDEWDKFFEEDETDWCTKQKAKVDIVQNKIHGKIEVSLFFISALFRETCGKAQKERKA